MHLYRAKDIGDREQLKETCLRIIRNGNAGELLRILPHISILRPPELVEPLLNLLHIGTNAQKEAAALALAGLADDRTIRALGKTIEEAILSDTPSSHSLQTAIVVALGETGKAQAVLILQKIYALNPAGDSFRSQRRRLIVSSLGRLAQQGISSARQELLHLLKAPQREIRAEAVTELAISFWHQPKDIPETILERILEAARSDSDQKVRKAALSALNTLRRLGSRSAAGCLDRT